MKYRAGVPPPRPKGHKRVSEYNKAFHWKTPVEQSPLLAAEQVSYQHGSKTHYGPEVKNRSQRNLVTFQYI